MDRDTQNGRIKNVLLLECDIHRFGTIFVISKTYQLNVEYISLNCLECVWKSVLINIQFREQITIISFFGYMEMFACRLWLVSETSN